MKPSIGFQLARSTARKVGVTILPLVLLTSVALSTDEKKAKPMATPTPTGSPKSTPTPKPAPTPDTVIDSKMKAELLAAEDRLLKAIKDRDVKALEEILHAGFADAIEGSEVAVNKRGFLVRATAGRLPAYKIEKERVIERSGDSFTVAGTARDTTRELPHDHRATEWARVWRIWDRSSGQWIATAQNVDPTEEHDEKEQPAPEKKEK